jgi:hypothetical protein
LDARTEFKILERSPKGGGEAGHAHHCIRNIRLADFAHNFNKTRQTLSDVILQEGDGVAVIPTLAKKITSELAEVNYQYSPILISNNID